MMRGPDNEEQEAEEEEEVHINRRASLLSLLSGLLLHRKVGFVQDSVSVVSFFVFPLLIFLSLFYLLLLVCFYRELIIPR